MSKNKILVVEDNLIMKKLLDSILSRDFEVKSFGRGDEALHEVHSFLPDLIILDIMLPDQSGYEICSQIKSDDSLSHIPIVILSAKTGTAARSTGYNLGAINYIEKPFEVTELLSIVKSVLKNQSGISLSDILKYGDLELSISRQEVYFEGEVIAVTANEFKILSYLFKRPNEVISRDDFLNVLMAGEDHQTSDRAIDNHMSSIRKKLKGAKAKIKSIYGEGYKLVS